MFYILQRVVGWLQFEHDDALGRSEYVGQVIRIDAATDDGTEDGLGYMTWTDDTTYAGDYNKHHMHVKTCVCGCVCG